MPAPVRQSSSKTRKAAQGLRVKSRGKGVARFLITFLLLVAAFVAGFIVRSNVSFVQSLGIPTEEALLSQSASGITKPKSTYESLSARMSEVEDMLASYSFDEVPLDDTTNSLLSDLMECTGDPYAAYFDPARYEKYIQEAADRKFSGVGVLFGDHDGKAYAIDVLEGSEAQAEGVQQGDFVQAIDGESDHLWSASEVIGALAKEDGDHVVITWMRPISLDAKSGKEFTTNLVCRDYDIKNVTYEMHENIGYVKVSQITGNSAQLVKDAVASLVSQGAAAFVLDLTDNPGGYLTQSLDIASLFVQSGVLVGIKTVDGTTTRTATGVTETSAPMVVMINGYTSGVAEVLAAALQDNQRATTVGQRTTGKGSVQVTRELTFGGAIRYTAAYYLTPNGHEINGLGITPDIEVANPEAGPDGEQENMQLLVALDTARSLIGAQ